jgi:hypothetical protein
MTQQSGHLFTPRVSHASEERRHLRISDADLRKVLSVPRGSNWRGVVEDLETGDKIAVRGAPCGLGCECDAIIVGTETRGSNAADQ